MSSINGDGSLNAVILTGTSNILTNDLDTAFDFSNIITHVYEKNRDVIDLSLVPAYVIIEYDINAHISKDFSNATNDDSWDLSLITLSLDNTDTSKNLYDATNVSISLPSETKNNIALAQLDVLIYQDASFNIDSSTSESTRLEVNATVSVTSGARYELLKSSVDFSGDLASYTLKENASEYQIAGFKVENSTDASLSTIDEYGDHSNNDLTDILGASVSPDIGSTLTKPSVNIDLLKKWYNESITTLVSLVHDVSAISDLSFEINPVSYATNSTLSKWARTKITQDPSGNQLWSDGVTTRDLSNPFYEGEYLICSNPFAFQPTVKDTNEDVHTYNDNTSGTKCYVVLKQKTGKDVLHYGN